MARRRVVVTGLGVVTSLGENHDEMWDNLCAGVNGIGPVRRWDCSKYPVRIGGECLNFDIANYGMDVREGECGKAAGDVLSRFTLIVETYNSVQSDTRLPDANRASVINTQWRGIGKDYWCHLGQLYARIALLDRKSVV